MRCSLLGLFLLAAVALAQTGQTPFRPDITIVAREHSLGPDIVEVTLSKGDYPEDLLRRQLEDFGKRLGSAPRGLAVGSVQLDPGNPSLKFLKARFAVDGFIDRPQGALRIEPLLRAFAGAPEPYTIGTILLLFDGERPGAGTVKRHQTDAVEAEGRVNDEPPMIEYAIVLKSQTPDKIAFPDKVLEQSAVPQPSQQESGTPVLFWGAVAAASLAAGALVYLALLRGGSGRR